MIEFANPSFVANLLASDVNIAVGGNLLLKSRQNLLESDSYSIGGNLGISGGQSAVVQGATDSTSSSSYQNPLNGGINGGNVGFNLGSGYSNRAWTDQVSSIIGTNSVNINVDNNTNIVGALIANRNKDGKDLGNLNLSTASLTYSDLKNFSASESNQLGLNLQVGKNPNNPTQNGNLAINLAMQGRESSSDTKATIGQGNITVGGNLNDETKLAGLNRDIANVEQNKTNLLTSDFDAELKIDLRLLAAVGNLAIGNTDKAVANWDSYATETKRGTNISYDALAIPLTSLGKTISGEVNISDALLATGKNYQNLYHLAYNQKIIPSDLAGKGKLITYNGNQLDATSQARYAEGFYDRIFDISAINTDSNRRDSQLAGTLAHEGGHRMFRNNGQSYTQSEENASHMIGDYVQSRWNVYQGDNSTLRNSITSISSLNSSFSSSLINLDNNFYANNVKFGNDVNPLIPALPIVAPVVYEVTIAAGTALATAFGLKKTKDLINENSGSSSSNIATSSVSSSSVAGGMPDPDDEDKNNTTDHAKQRQEERGINDQEVQNAIKNGDKYYDPKNNSIQYINKTSDGKYVQVAVDPKSGNIKTTIKSSDINKLVRPRFEKID